MTGVDQNFDTSHFVPMTKTFGYLTILAASVNMAEIFSSLANGAMIKGNFERRIED